MNPDLRDPTPAVPAVSVCIYIYVGWVYFIIRTRMTEHAARTEWEITFLFMYMYLFFQVKAAPELLIARLLGIIAQCGVGI